MGPYFVLFSAILATALANVAIIKKCDEAAEEVCSVSQVRIEPCEKPSLCVFRQGHDANLNFDFTPNFAATKLSTQVYWEQTVGDIPFSGMDTDGCKYTQCPTQPGRTQTLNYNLPINKETPKGKYLIKWKVWDEENDKQLCCFKANIQIKKKA